MGMVDTRWTLTPTDGSVTMHTGVAGRAARTGHRLAIEMTEWSATVVFDGDEPSSVEATIAVESLQVLSGEGGITPMTGPEKSMARGNALKSLKADTYPDITYASTSITRSGNGYHIDGDLTICGQTRPQPLDITTTEANGRWEIAADVALAQTDFGVKRYSLMMGALKVADEVRIEIRLTHA